LEKCAENGLLFSVCGISGISQDGCQGWRLIFLSVSSTVSLSKNCEPVPLVRFDNEISIFQSGDLMKKTILTASITLLALFSNLSTASIDLSTSGFNPTQLTFSVGDNRVEARLDPTQGADSRFFTFNIANGYLLNSIQLEAFSYSQIASNPIATGVAFFGLKQGVSITPSTSNPAAVDGYALLGAPISSTPINNVIPTNIGEDLFPSLIATGAYTGTTLPSALGAGDYTVWLRESRTIDVFSLNFKVAAVPVPGAVWLMGSVLVGFVGLGKRRQLLKI